MTKKIDESSESSNSKIRIHEYKETGIKTQYIGACKVQRLDTGEIFDLEQIQKVVSHSLKGGWRRVYLENFMEILTGLYAQGRKIQVVEFILDNIDSNNKLTMNQTQVIERSGIARKTVVETYKHLVKCGFMKKVDSVYVVNPKYVCAFGSDKKNANILLKIRQEEEQKLPQFEASSPETA